MACNSNTMPLIEEGSEILNCKNGCEPKDINVICKKIIIPYGQEKIAIQGENNAETRVFLVPKTTSDGVDLTNKAFYIMTKDSQNIHISKEVTDIDIDTYENYIKITWTITSDFTANVGVLYFQIKAEGEDYIWKTEVTQFTVIKAIDKEDLDGNILNLQSKTVIPTSMEQTVLPDYPYNGLSSVIVLGEGTGISYNNLSNKPSINDIELIGNKTLYELGIEKNDYIVLKDVKDYLFETYYGNVDYDYAYKYFLDNQTDLNIGACSSVRNDNFYGRNLDWLYDKNAEFIVNMPRIADRYASIGVATNIPILTNDFVKSREFSRMYKIVPFKIVDGINEKGVIINTNVVPLQESSHEPSIPTEETLVTICSSMLCRYVLDYFATAQAAVDYIQKYVSIYFPKNLIDMGYETHYMIADEDNTYLLEIINRQVVITDMTENSESHLAGKSYMTNFHLSGVELNSNGTVYTPETQDSEHNAKITNLIEDFGAGLERYNLIVENFENSNTKNGMRDLMNSLKYTNAYKLDTNPVWNTEFVDIDNLTVISPAEDFISVRNYANVMFNNRSRDRESEYYGTWQTTHSSVYDIKNRKLYIIVQEDGEELEYTLDYYYTSTEIDKLLEEVNDNIKDLDESKQNLLKSGINIKTINNQSILGSGNIDIQGGGGTSDYTDLTNKPKINNVELSGNKSLQDLGVQPAGNYLTEETDPTVPNHIKAISQTDINNWNNKSDFSGNYNDLTNKPTIPTVPTNVSAFTNDAGYLTQHQDISGKENSSNKVTTISASSTDTQYCSAKCVYDLVGNIESLLGGI